MKSAEVSQVNLADILRNRRQGLAVWFESVEQILHGIEVFSLRGAWINFDSFILLGLRELQSRKEVLHGVEVINLSLNSWLFFNFRRLAIDSCEQLLHGCKFLEVDLRNDWDFADIVSRSGSFSCLWHVLSAGINGLEEILEGGKLLACGFFFYSQANLLRNCHVFSRFLDLALSKVIGEACRASKLTPIF